MDGAGVMGAAVAAMGGGGGMTGAKGLLGTPAEGAAQPLVTIVGA